MPVQRPHTTIQFGLFELDTAGRELYRGGIRIKLAPQPYDLLHALIEQPAVVVSREVLQQRLWPPNTHVDYEQGLNKTVRKLREALGDSAESPRYIETVQRAGYRFIAPVIRRDATVLEIAPPAVETGSVPESATQQETAAARHWGRWSWTARFAVGVVLLGAVAALGLVWRRASLRGAHLAANKAVDLRAEEAYLHGRYLWFGEHALASSDYFRRAIELKPDYAPAWAGMSMYYGAALLRGRLDPAEGVALLEESATKSLALAPSLPEAHLAMCGAIFVKMWQFDAANVECNRALELDPKDAEVYHLQSKMLAAVNRQREAVETQRTGTHLDPLSRPWALGQALMEARRYDEALSETGARLESFPHDPTLLRLMADIYRDRGNDAQAAEYLEQSYRYNGDEPSAIQVRQAFRSGGYRAVARWDLERLLKREGSGYVSPVVLARAYGQLADREHSLAMLSRALERHAPGLLWIRCYPEFDQFERDPRYQQILAKLPG